MEDWCCHIPVVRNSTSTSKPLNRKLELTQSSEKSLNRTKYEWDCRKNSKITIGR